MSELLVKSRVKELAHKNGKRMSADALRRLNEHIEEVIMKAVKLHNGGRKTVVGFDVTYILPTKKSRE